MTSREVKGAKRRSYCMRVVFVLYAQKQKSECGRDAVPRVPTGSERDSIIGFTIVYWLLLSTLWLERAKLLRNQKLGSNKGGIEQTRILLVMLQR